LPNEPVQFLSLDEAIAIHEALIARFGGPPGVRDKGMLQSALFRPQTGYYTTLPEMAAALFESLINNHAFIDGNKRVAFFTCDVFLRLNGWKLQVNQAEAHDFIISTLEKGECKYEKLLPWIQTHIIPLA
jgi:death-on-curing protein